MITPAQWPDGINMARRFEHWKLRQCVPILRGTIEKLASESPTAEWFDAAAAAFTRQFAISGPRHPGRRALDRLARLYIRHFRRELVRQHQYIEAAARWALIGAGLRERGRP
jgi:hypothetical protein